jgi:hypothetical protein
MGAFNISHNILLIFALHSQRPRQEDLIAMAMQRGFRPVKLNQKEAALAVSQILENRTPVVKPLVDQSPIPPIPSYQRV